LDLDNLPSNLQSEVENAGITKELLRADPQIRAMVEKLLYEEMINFVKKQEPKAQEENKPE